MVGIISLHGRNFAVPVRTGSTLPGEEKDPILHLKTTDNKVARSLTSNELIMIIQQWKSQLQSNEGRDGVQTRSSCRPVLVLDRSALHTSKEFRAAMQELRQEVLFLPPRSHDLDPCDSHFFAVVKNRTKNGIAKSADQSWSSKVAELRKQMDTVQANPHIANYIKKLEACIEAEGRRFDGAYKKGRVADNAQTA